VWISKREIEKLSEAVRGYASGELTDIRDNDEGAFSVLKNDIYRLADLQTDQINRMQKQRDKLADYMSDVSHQLKTPITSMLIMIDLLEDAEPEKQEEFISNIKHMLGKMEWLVKSLLSMAKIDAGAVEFLKKEILVSELMKDVYPSVNILLDINSQETLQKNDIMITCDKRWTVEALINIVKNAIEHSPSGSKIEIDCGENPIYSWISVRDYGQGIDVTEYAALFRRFGSSTNESGFGIGMPLALSIMKGQGGDVDVEKSSDGPGTKFILKFFK